MQKRAREEAEKRIALMSKFEKFITLADAVVVAVAQEIMESVGENTMGVTVEEFLNIGCHAEPLPFYLGYTAQCLVDEALRWLTQRGASWADADGNRVDDGSINRPVLLWSDGSTITMTDAQTKLGFTFFEVYASTLKINARAVEKALQARYHRALPLGQRLWRRVDMGSKYEKEVDGKLHTVFITFSPLAGQMLAEGKIKVDF